MKKLFTHLLITLIASLLLFSSLTATPVRAATTGNWVDFDYPTCIEYATDPNGPQGVCKGGYFSSGQGDVMADWVRRTAGPVSGVTVTADVWQRNPQYAQRMLQGSAVAGISNYIAMMYANPPADFALWIRDTGQTLGFIPKIANAQGPGIGFTGLAPLLPLWKAFRNIAYLLLAIVMIVIGFMVMFRKKIDPKTVVTVQNALPKIVVTLLLITFSYAIVGLMIDFMYLLIVLFVSIIGQSGIFPAQDISAYQTQLVSGNLGTLFNFVFIKDGWTAYFKLLPAVIVGIFGGVGAGAVIGSIAALFFSWNLGIIAGVGALVGGILIVFLLSLILLFALFRIFYMLLMAYITIVLSLILAPLQLLIEAFPGGNGFSGWFRNLLSNILVFPATAILLLLASSFTKLETTGIWAPPLLLGGSTGGSIPGLLALGVLLIIPTLANAIKDALKPPEFKYGGAPAQAITSVLGFPVSFVVGMGQTAFTHALYSRGGAKPKEEKK